MRGHDRKFVEDNETRRKLMAINPGKSVARLGWGVADQEHPFDRCPSHWLDLGVTTVDALSEDKRYAEWRRRLVDIEQLMLDLGGRYDPRQERPAGAPTPRFRLHDSLLYDMGFGRRWERELRPKTPTRVDFPSADGPREAIYLTNRFSSAIEALDACELVYVGFRPARCDTLNRSSLRCSGRKFSPSVVCRLQACADARADRILPLQGRVVALSEL
jgi:hypothetical protein